ncbi:hypothetical protein M0802_008749 [Mischocyttarus mexicanus]|nr:hypothetical protein M0802_008749 [Mischocyttarus mexicanus]
MRIAMGICMQLCRLHRCVTLAYYTSCHGIAYSLEILQQPRGPTGDIQATSETPLRRYESCKAVNATTLERARLQPHGASHMKPQESSSSSSYHHT